MPPRSANARSGVPSRESTTAPASRSRGSGNGNARSSSMAAVMSSNAASANWSGKRRWMRSLPKERKAVSSPTVPSRCRCCPSSRRKPGSILTLLLAFLLNIGSNDNSKMDPGFRRDDDPFHSGHPSNPRLVSLGWRARHRIRLTARAASPSASPDSPCRRRACRDGTCPRPARAARCKYPESPRVPGRTIAPCRRC